MSVGDKQLEHKTAQAIARLFVYDLDANDIEDRLIEISKTARIKSNKTKQVEILTLDNDWYKLYDYPLADNHKEIRRRDTYPLEYGVKELFDNPNIDPAIQSKKNDRFFHILELLSKKNIDQFYDVVHLQEVINFAMQKGAPIEFYQKLTAYIPPEKYRALVNDAIDKSPFAFSVFFNRLRETTLLDDDKQDTQSYVNLVEIALEAKAFNQLNALLTEEMLTNPKCCVDSKLRRQWVEFLITPKLFDEKESDTKANDFALFIDRLIITDENKPSKEELSEWLHHAIKADKFYTASVLLQHGADPNLPNKDGQTALHFAAMKKGPQFITLLNQYSADFHVRDVHEKLPIDYANKITQQAITQINQVVITDNDVDDKSNITHLAIRGGGVKGYAYLAAIKEAEKQNLFKLAELEGVSGASAGAITAALIALNFNVEELDTHLGALDFKQFFDFYNPDTESDIEHFKGIGSGFSEGGLAVVGAVWGLLGKGIKYLSGKSTIATFMEKKGLAQGDKFLKWIDDRIKEQTKKAVAQHGDKFEHLKKYLDSDDFSMITFKDLQELGFKDLRVVATDANRQQALWFSAEETPDALVADAIRASMAYPGMFSPHKYYIRNEQGEREVHPDYIDVELGDGGILDNFPVRAFDKKPGSNQTVYNEHVLGLYLATPEEKKKFEYGIAPAIQKFTNGLHYVFGGVIASLIGHQEHMHSESVDTPRTVYIDTGDVSAMDFNFNAEQKKKLDANGIQAIHDYISRQVGQKVFNKLSEPTLNLVISFAGANLQKVEPDRTVIHLDTLQLTPYQIVTLYANCNDEELSRLQALVNPNSGHDKQGNSALHIALAAKVLFAKNNDCKLREERLTRINRAIQRLQIISANANALNNNKQTPEQFVQSESFEDIDAIVFNESFLFTSPKEYELLTRTQDLVELTEKTVQVESQLKEKTETLEQEQKQKEELRLKGEALQVQLDGAHSQIDENVKALKQEQEQKEALRLKGEALQVQLDSANTRLNEQSSMIDKATKEKDALNTHNKKLKQQLQDKSARLKTKDDMIQKLAEENARLKAQSANVRSISVSQALKALGSHVAVLSEERKKYNTGSYQYRIKSEKIDAINRLLQFESQAPGAANGLSKADTAIIRKGFFSRRGAHLFDNLLEAEKHEVRAVI